MARKKIAYLGLLISLAFIFSYLEFLIPINLGVPGVKLGLANLVIIVALYTIGEKETFFLSVVRILLVGFTFGNLSMMIYSFAGGMASYLVMILTKKVGAFTTKGVSALGGVFHNIGQIVVAMLMLETTQLVYYLPILMVAGIVSGVIIGLLASMVIVRVEKYYRKSA